MFFQILNGQRPDFGQRPKYFGETPKNDVAKAGIETSSDTNVMNQFGSYEKYPM